MTSVGTPTMREVQFPGFPEPGHRGGRRRPPRAATARTAEGSRRGRRRRTSNHDRGRLVMACGTGKTFAALRIAETTVADGGRILFAAPTIALVSQARREWLRHTTRPLDSLVVCSDPSPGGRREDIRRSELEARSPPTRRGSPNSSRTPATRPPCSSRTTPSAGSPSRRHGHEAPAFDLAVADEAHRTTGIDRSSLNGFKVDFQEFTTTRGCTPRSAST